MYIQRKLSNGIRVATENVPYVNSLSVGVWVGNGSRYEKAEESGISHFIEHMLFKGTARRTAGDIAREIDSVGGQINAFTTRECTCFCTRTLNEYAETAVDVLSDMLFNSVLSAAEMDMERQVVLEEIAMYNDSPEDVVYDAFDFAVWGDTPMGRPILGSERTLSNVTPDTMRRYIKTHYTSENIVIAAAGKFDETLFELLEKYFGERSILSNDVTYESAVYHAADVCLERDFEQIQLAVGFRGIDIYDDSVYALNIFNNIFGSGMSSRLFQNIRESHGLVYTISAGHSPYEDVGMFDISAAMSERNAEKVAELIRRETETIKRDKLTADEIDHSKRQLKGNYLLSIENVDSRMQALGRAVLLGRLPKTPEETIEIIDKVSRDDIADIIDRVLDTDTMSIAAAGEIGEELWRKLTEILHD